MILAINSKPCQRQETGQEATLASTKIKTCSDYFLHGGEKGQAMAFKSLPFFGLVASSVIVLCC